MGDDDYEEQISDEPAPEKKLDDPGRRQKRKRLSAEAKPAKVLGIKKEEQARKKPKKPLAPEWLVPRNVVSFCLNTQLFGKIMTFLKTFHNEINFIFEQNGFKITMMDTSHTSLLHVNVVGTGLEQWNWSLSDSSRKDFCIGVNLEAIIKVLKVGGEKFVRCIVSPDRDVMTLEFFGEDPKTRGPKFVDPYVEKFPVLEMRLMDIELKDLEIPPNDPDIVVRLRADELHALLAHVKSSSDEVKLSFTYDKKTKLVRTDEAADRHGKLDEIKKEIHGKNSTKQDLIDRVIKPEVKLTETSLMVSFKGEGSNGNGKIPFNLYFEGLEGDEALDDERDEGYVPPWERYEFIVRPPPRDEDGEERLPKDGFDAEVEERVEYTILHKMRELEKKKASDKKKPSEKKRYGTIVSSRCKTTELPDSSFGSKLMNNATLGKTINDHVLIEFYENMPIALRYELPEDMGHVACYLAPKMDNSEL